MHTSKNKLDASILQQNHTIQYDQEMQLSQISEMNATLEYDMREIYEKTWKNTTITNTMEATMNNELAKQLNSTQLKIICKSHNIWQ